MVKGGLCMSGMYDLKPVRLSKRSTYVKFNDEIEQAMSSQRRLDLLRTPIIVTYGTHETPEFQRQNRDFAAAVRAAAREAKSIRCIWGCIIACRLGFHRRHAETQTETKNDFLCVSASRR